MTKFIAKTNVSVSVALDGGSSVYISFSPLTGGGSVFYTEDKALAAALKRHYKFGRLFVLAEEKDEPQVARTATKQAPKAIPVDEVSVMTVVEVTDPDEAKDYLNEKFGVSRTKLKSLSAIKTAATEHGIEFRRLE